MLNARGALPIKTVFMSDEAAACTHVHNCHVLLVQDRQLSISWILPSNRFAATSPPPPPPHLLPLPLLFLLHVAFTKARYRVEEEIMSYFLLLLLF